MQKIMGGFVIVALVAMAALTGNLFQNVDADEIVVIQSPTGTLTWHTDPGIKGQWFGKVTIYPKRDMYEFKEPIRFNDNGKGTVDGSVQFEYPLDPNLLTEIHQRFNNPHAVREQLVARVVNKAAYYAGPLMSSRESFAERKNDLIWYVQDQIENGVYRTRQRDAMVKDEFTEQEKRVTVVEIVTRDGKPERAEEAQLSKFGLTPFNLAFRVDYAPEVEQQLSQQQNALMDIQLAVAEAKKAEQRARTVEEQGRARAAEERWKQEAIKAQAVTEAQQQKEVAELEAKKAYEVARINAEQKLEVEKLSAQTAEQYKKAQLLRADADATYKQRVLEADGALAQKLETYQAVQALWAQALSQFHGPLVPSVVMAGGPGAGGPQSSGGNAAALVDLLTARTAQQLALDMSIPQGAQTARR